jgi:hypothetical protein
MARPKTDKKTAKTTKAKKGDASPTKARKGRAPEAPPFEDPAPGVAGDVLRVTASTWEAFDADATERLIAPLELARVVWEDRGAYHVTEPVTPRVALALEKVLRELGCVELEGSRRANGGEVRTFMEGGA